jgi:DNA-binding CsgD family transcriptional regulator
MRAGGDITVSNELKLDGETFHLLEHISPVRDESGNVSSVMIIGKRIAWVPEKSDPVPNESLQLSPRELEILQLIGSGLTTSQIAEKLFISRKTVESHRARVMRRLGIHKSSALVQYAVKSGLF